MTKRLDLELFEPGFIFEYKGIKYIVLKAHRENVSALPFNTLEVLNYADIEEDAISSEEGYLLLTNNNNDTNY